MQRLLIGWILFGLSLGFTGQSWAGAEYQEFVLQNAVVATADGASMPVTKYTTVALDVTIATTATVTFEGSVSGAAWTSIACTAINTGVTTTAPTATGLYQCNVAGLSAFRARVSSWTAGAVTVYARATTAETGGIFAFLASVFDYVNTALRVTLATLISGEDQTNNVLRVEFQFSRSVVTTDTLVKTGAGFIHRIVCWGSDAAATAGDIAVRDATSAGAGTIILDRLIPAAALTPANDELNVPFTTGLYIDYTTTADVTCTLSYR